MAKMWVDFERRSEDGKFVICGPTPKFTIKFRCDPKEVTDDMKRLTFFIKATPEAFAKRIKFYAGGNRRFSSETSPIGYFDNGECFEIRISIPFDVRIDDTCKIIVYGKRILANDETKNLVADYWKKWSLEEVPKYQCALIREEDLPAKSEPETEGSGVKKTEMEKSVIMVPTSPAAPGGSSEAKVDNTEGVHWSTRLCVMVILLTILVIAVLGLVFGFRKLLQIVASSFGSTSGSRGVCQVGSCD